MAHFTEGSSVQKAIDSLKKHGIDDVEELYDPVTGRNINVMVGPMYFTRLVHIAEDKQSSRSQGLGYSWNMQPAKSDEESSKRVGNLATNALLAHNATAVLRDIATVKGTRNDEFWRRLKLGQPAPMPTVPFIFEKFVASMRGAGIKVDQRGSKFNLLPMIDKDVIAMSKGAIDSPLMFKTKKDQLVAEEGGLFDPVKVGILGNQYNHVDLNFPVPNPISEDYLRKLLGTTKVQFEQLMTSNQLTGKLAAINVTAKIEEYRKYLRSGKKTNRDNAVKVLGFLLMLQKNNIQPKDLMLSKIPVIPAQFRPTINQGDMSLTADINNLYKDLIMTNNTLKGNQEDLPAELVEKLRKQQYEAVKAVYGLGDPISTKNKEKGIKGLLATSLGIKGGSAKMAMFQSNVVNKPLDLVGRAVLTPDAKLDLDEASVPQDIIWKTYLPFIIRRLVLQGVPATKAAEYVKLRNPIARAAMMAELPHRPAIIRRDPSLHKFNLTGFFLKPNPDNKDKTVKLNPLVFKSFNADNDGDQLNINVPAGEEARQEVLQKMLPSKILLSPKNFAPVYTPSNEAALGLYQASTENDHNPPKKFPNEQAVIEAFQKGLIGPGEVVEIG
jgi:DNA-directed RNA polymerase beta' subunit